eukprot:TRINITY_DN4077_c0_g1_i1.p1 TRINITY_DN4077_c0_g1~~TRINITY_DN4077_c0_g1_i1.p1  ORF type:complete len:301 (+),score=64.31 TRINITY_DN4077_c0_g1_i1:49-951(+)
MSHPSRNMSSRGSFSSYSDLDSSSGSEVEVSWVAWFCSLRGHDFMVEVDERFVEDSFNMTGLPALVPNYDFARDMVLDLDVDYELSPDQTAKIERSAQLLYGLVHARYIITTQGLDKMQKKYQNVQFGRCPRVNCTGQPALPVGLSDAPRASLAKLYCPKCGDIFYPPNSKHSRIDGAYFGTTFPHLFIQVYPEHIAAPPKQEYVPRIFGFKIHSSSKAVLLEQVERDRQKRAELNSARKLASSTSALPPPSSATFTPPAPSPNNVPQPTNTINLTPGSAVKDIPGAGRGGTGSATSSTH